MTVQASDLVIKTFSNKDDITRYIENEVGPKMGVWRPRGVVLHNTGSPTLAQFNRGPHGPITDQQRILNSIPDWQKRGFSGMPARLRDAGALHDREPVLEEGHALPVVERHLLGDRNGRRLRRGGLPAGDARLRDARPRVPLRDARPRAGATRPFICTRKIRARRTSIAPGRTPATKVEWIDRITERMRFLHPGELSHDAPAHEEPKQTKATVDVPAHDFLMLRKAAGAAAQLVNPLPPGTR
jgi:hypothetical protein